MGAIPRCERQLCSPLLLEEDGVVEETELFHVTLEMSPGLDPRVKLRNFIHQAEVYLLDNDRKCVNYISNMYICYVYHCRC